MSATCSAITSERNTTNSMAAASITTIAMNTGSLPESTSAKSIPTAAAPPTKSVAPGLEPATSWADRRSCTKSCAKPETTDSGRL
jgi:hypothetical protein